MTFPVLSANGPSGYNLTRSLRFRSSASAYLSRTPASASNQKTFTWSGWVKRGTLGTEQCLFANRPVSGYFYFGFLTDTVADQLVVTQGSATLYLGSTAVFRDPSAWYHIVLAIDTTQATASNRIKMYVNGVQITSFGATQNYGALNLNTQINSATQHDISGAQPTSANYFDGYMAEVNFVDGQQLTPSSFGSTNSKTGVWQPAKYTGTYGTNGFYLPFTNTTSTTTLGYDSSGNGNNWTPNNISLTAGSTYDSMTDVPTLTSATAANYCVLNPLFTNQTGINSTNTGTIALTNGNLLATTVGAATIAGSVGTMGVSSGKWYFETTIGTASASGDFYGFITSFSGATTTWAGYRTTGSIYNNGTVTSSYATATAGDIIGIALDIGGNTISCYKNNTLLATTTLNTAITDYCYPLIWFRNDPANASANFGQRPFSYTPPSGFVALNTYNLPASTVPNGAAYMAATLYTGTSASQTLSNAVGSTSFQPDFVWAKMRGSASQSHQLYDSVRGVNKLMQSDTTAAEATVANSMTSFNSDGFTVGSAGNSNLSTYTYVGWQWKAGGTAISNTNGSITSSVSANTTSGFSVVTYTGTGAAGTVGHGLGVAPRMVIVKDRTSVANWYVWHTTLTASEFLLLNQTSAIGTSSTIWNNSLPTSTVFGSTNWGSDNMVAYCFAAIKGFSAFGSYTGNGSATDGPFIYTGFRPRYVLIKRTDASTGADWFTYDTSRNPYNTANLLLFSNLSDAEAASGGSSYLDILSNGFKARGNSNGINASAATYIYAAFAESPFQNSLAR